MREILSIHIGQAGNQIGFAIWELLCAEHGIDRSGTIANRDEDNDRSFSSFFSESHCGQFVPRGLFVDLDPTVINQLRVGSYRGLYNPTQLINSNDDSSGNFARAFNTIGRLLYRTLEQQFRKQVESCDYLQFTLFHRSLAGGSGSGLTSMIFELLEDYKKTIRIEVPIHPSPHFDSCVIGPYNSILGEHFCMEECDVGLLLDNEALFDISCNILDIPHPTMTSINRIIGQVNSCITASSRFNSDLFNDINAVLTNLVPYPRIHFPLLSFAPLGNSFKLNRDENDIVNITKSVFEADNQLIKVDLMNGRLMACSLVYRGLVNTSEIYSTLSLVKANRTNRFVDWCPTGFKVGIVDQPPLILPQSFMGDTKASVVMMTNTSAVSAVWQRLAQKFHRLYAKRSFVHWYVGEGLEESEFCEALYNLATLAKDYEEVAIDTKVLELDIGGPGGVGEEGEGGIPKVVINPAEGGENVEKEKAAKGENDESNSSNFNTNCIPKLLNENYFGYGVSKENEQIMGYDFSKKDQSHLKSWKNSENQHSNSISLSINSNVYINDSFVQFSHRKTKESNKNNDDICQQKLISEVSNCNSNNWLGRSKGSYCECSKNSISDSEDEVSSILNILVNKTFVN